MDLRETHRIPESVKVNGKKVLFRTLRYISASCSELEVEAAAPRCSRDAQLSKYLVIYLPISVSHEFICC